MKLLLLLTLLISTSSTYAGQCSSLTDELPTQAGGRVKPLFVLAKESMKFLTGKSTSAGKTSTQSFCQIMIDGLNSNESINILVEHVDTKKLLSLTSEVKSMPAAALAANKDLIRSEIFKLKENNSYKKDLSRLYTRIELFEGIYNFKTLTLYRKNSEGKFQWSPLTKEEFKGPAKKLKELLLDAKASYIKDKNDKFLTELTFVKANFFSYALLLSLIAIFMAVLFKKMKYAIIFSIATIALEVVAISFRVYISGRAPITNMYETVMFSGFGGLIISLIIYAFKRDKIFVLAGLGYNILCIFMLTFANGMLSSSISPLVPVLRDNFWLSTHVSTIILSYAALALSWMIANITLFQLHRNKFTNKEYNYYQDLVYTCIKVGIILLAAGIILGGVWADYSWGRFWGWDPKETWSLIVLLFYMALLHGKNTKWVTNHRFVLFAAAGFMTVMMAWFGVNYILASGLHSYGFSEGGAIFLGSFFLVQSILIFIFRKRPSIEK